MCLYKTKQQQWILFWNLIIKLKSNLFYALRCDFDLKSINRSYQFILNSCHFLLNFCGMNHRAVVRSTLSTHCRLFISRPVNHTTTMCVYNHIQKDCQFSVTPNSFTSVQHKCVNGSISEEMASYDTRAYILFIQACKIWTNLLLIKFVAPGCRHYFGIALVSC